MFFKVVYASPSDDNHVVVVSDEWFEAERDRLRNPEYLPRVHADGLTRPEAERVRDRFNERGQEHF